MLYRQHIKQKRGSTARSRESALPKPFGRAGVSMLALTVALSVGVSFAASPAHAASSSPSQGCNSFQCRMDAWRQQFEQRLAEMRANYLARIAESRSRFAQSQLANVRLRSNAQSAAISKATNTTPSVRVVKQSAPKAVPAAQKTFAAAPQVPNLFALFQQRQAVFLNALHATALGGGGGVVFDGCQRVSTGGASGSASCQVTVSVSGQTSSIGTPPVPNPTNPPAPNPTPGSHAAVSGTIAVSGTVAVPTGHSISVNQGVSGGGKVGTSFSIPGAASGVGSGLGVASGLSVGDGSANATGSGGGNSFGESANSGATANSNAGGIGGIGAGIGIGGGIGLSGSAD